MNEITEPTIISGRVIADGSNVPNQALVVKGYKVVFCPPIVYCDDSKKVSSSTTLSDNNGEFNISLEPNQEVDYYEIFIKGTIPGTTKCSGYSTKIYPEQNVANIDLFVFCE